MGGTSDGTMPGMAPEQGIAARGGINSQEAEPSNEITSEQFAPPRAPNMVILDAVIISQESSPELAALRKRYGSWWKPTFNVLKALHNLGDDDALKEFRRGDVKFLDLDETLSMNGSKKSPGPGGLIDRRIEQMYF